MKALGIIFSNIYDSVMGELTRKRTIASLPFGGRYRQIDFVLSNMVNSGVYRVGVIVKHNYQSLMDHLSDVNEWDLSRKNGGLFILPPFGAGQTDVYRGKLDALYGIVGFIENSHCDHVVFCDSTIICNVDFKDVIKSHVESGADITVVANHENSEDYNDKRELVLTKSEDKVTDIQVDALTNSNIFTGMGMYVMEKHKLLEAIYGCIAHGRYHFEKDFLQREFIDNNLDVNLYEFNGCVLRNRNIIKYFHNNFELMKPEVRKDLFSAKRPIYTKIRDEVPSYFGKNSKVCNCLVADGCVVRGKVENSILCRGVVVGENAVIKNSVIMQGSRVESGASIKYAILDKDVYVTRDRVLVGADTSPIIVNKGLRV